MYRLPSIPSNFRPCACLETPNIAPTKIALSPSSLFVSPHRLLVVLQRYAARARRLKAPSFSRMPDLWKPLRPRLAPFDEHDGREYRDEEDVSDDDVHHHSRRARHQIQPYACVRSSCYHDHPAKVAVYDAEEGAVAFALEYHMVPPADEKLHDCGDENNDPDSFVAGSLALAVVVSVGDGKPDGAPDDGDDGCHELRDPVPADRFHEA